MGNERCPRSGCIQWVIQCLDELIVSSPLYYRIWTRIWRTLPSAEAETLTTIVYPLASGYVCVYTMYVYVDSRYRQNRVEAALAHVPSGVEQ